YSQAFEPWQVVIGSGVYMDDVQAQISSAIWNAVIICGLVFVVGIAFAIYVMRGITKPLADIYSALNAVADENVSIAIPHTGMSNEVGMMAKATAALQEKIRERHALAERQAAQEKEIGAERQRNQQQQQAEAEQQAQVVSTIGAALEQLAKGDLTVRC